jgi:hypothetical protein
MNLVGVALAVASLIATFAVLFRFLVSRNKSEMSSLEWLESFTVDSYAPMERLLDRGDFAFLASQPGYRPEIAKRLLSERRRLFKVYLGMLVRDFHRLLAIAKFMVVFSKEDRPEFAHALWRQQAIFYYAVSVLRCKVTFYPFGWTALDVPRVVHALEALRNQIQSVSGQQPAPFTA